MLEILNLKPILVACMFQNNSKFSESEHDLHSRMNNGAKRLKIIISQRSCLFSSSVFILTFVTHLGSFTPIDENWNTTG